MTAVNTDTAYSRQTPARRNNRCPGGKAKALDWDKVAIIPVALIIMGLKDSGLDARKRRGEKTDRILPGRR